MQLGYNEINLNLGCPSATVVSKNRGSGFLSKTDDLDAFLNEIFTKATTRIGKTDPEEFYEFDYFTFKIPAIREFDTSDIAVGYC